MADPETFEQWEARVEKFAEASWKDFEASGLSKTNPEHSHFVEGILKKVEAWKKANPPPSAPPRPPPPGPGLSSEAKIAELAEERRAAEAMRLAEGQRLLAKMQRARRLGRGVEGVSNIGTVVGVAGTAGAGAFLVAGGKMLFKLWVEDKILGTGVHVMEKTINAIDEANTPNTVADAEAMYKSYVASCDREVYTKGGPIHIRSPIMPKEEWLAVTYGVRWDALSK